MSAKPFHVGHHAMISRASSECDSVRVFVSLSDRRRSEDAVPILGADMAVIWREIIVPTVPTNVSVEYVSNPISSTWAALSDKTSGDTYVIYSGEQELAINFHDGLLEHYCGELLASGRILKVITERRCSGTQIRQLLASGDRDGFLECMPDGIDKSRVWDILSATARNPPKVKATSQPKKWPSPALKK